MRDAVSKSNGAGTPAFPRRASALRISRKGSVEYIKKVRLCRAQTAGPPYCRKPRFLRPSDAHTARGKCCGIRLWGTTGKRQACGLLGRRPKATRRREQIQGLRAVSAQRRCLRGQRNHERDRQRSGNDGATDGPPALRICQQPRGASAVWADAPPFSSGNRPAARSPAPPAPRAPLFRRRFCALSRFRPRPTSPSPRRKALSHSFVDSPAAICHNTIKSGRQFQKVDGSGGIV